MNKKQVTNRYDFERETRVLLEGLGSNIRTVAEGHGILIKNQEHLKADLESVKQAVLEDSQRIKELATGQERIEHKLDAVIINHETRFHKLEAAL